MMFKYLCLISLLSNVLNGFTQSVKLTEVNWHGTGCYKIEMKESGTVYFEKDNGVSGFKSFIDPEGKDWIASYMEPGPNGDFRGFPNSIDNFGHAGRDSGSVTTIVNGKTEGEVVILESTNGTFTFQYWFFSNRVAIKVLKSQGDYCFLLECVAGGTADAEDYFVTADGKTHIPTEDGTFDDFTPEWFYLGDPKSDYVLFLAKSPEDDAPNENHRQIRSKGQHNMDLYSFGRTGREHKYKVYGMRGNEHICVIGFANKKRTHNEITASVEAYLKSPFETGIKGAYLWGAHVLNHDAAWYASNEAKALANNVIKYQSSQGGWPKSTDLARPPLTPGDIPPEGGGRANSLDNDATTLPMAFLAKVISATKDETYIASFDKGLDYLVAAQYPNGGWPQFWPLRGDKYYSRITFNDDAMIQVMELLKAVASGKNEYAFVDNKRRELASKAIQLGLECILKSQIKQEGVPTVWCAQHDEKTLKPAWARAYEPPSLSGSESVGILRYLMSIEQPSLEVIRAIKGGVAWLKNVAITDKRLKVVRNPDGRNERLLIPDDNAPLLWARFYELDTNRPLYLDRDSKFRYDYSEISYERRSGYSYHGYWAKKLLEKDYPLWQYKYGITIDEMPDETLVAEAESGTFTGIVDQHSCWHNVMLSDAPHSSHSGRGYVDTKNEKGSYVEVVYKATWSGPHKIGVRYTHIKSDPRPAVLFVNYKKEKQLKLKQSEALPAWKMESAAVYLEKGMNIIRLGALKDGGLPNVDYIKVTELRDVAKGRIPRVKILEVEDGRYTGKEDHHSCWNFIGETVAGHSGFTGKGYVDTYNKKDSYIDVVMEAPTTGVYALGVRYVHGKPDMRPAKLSVNDEVINPLMKFYSTGTWTSWTTKTAMVSLKAGTNRIRLTALGEQGLVNIDHFSFSIKK